LELTDTTIDPVEGKQLLTRLDGLPLAISQAGAYLQESGVALAAYLSFYDQQWSKLMESNHLADAPLQDYPDRSVWTTWAISYQAIYNKHEATANLLLLWSFLDNKDLWHDLFAIACRKSPVITRMLSGWIGDIASSELEFSRAMQLLRNYSLVEEVAETASYATHPVVHQWAHHSQGKHFAIKLSQLAVVAVGWSVPGSSTRDYSSLQRRLLPHAQTCFKQIVKREAGWWLGADKEDDEDVDESEEQETVLDAIHCLGDLYFGQGKLIEAEQMYDRALQGYEEALGPTHTSTLNTVNNLGMLYAHQGKLGVAEQMYNRARRGYKEALGPTHTSTLNTANNLGALYFEQGKLGEAEQMYDRALQGYEKALGPTHTSTLDIVNNLGNLYADQGKLGEAEQMYERALRGKEEALGPTRTSTLNTVNNLGMLYADQGKLGEAEQMFDRALQGYEEALGEERVQQYMPALTTFENIGSLYAKQGETAKAQAMYARALSGLRYVLGQSSDRCVKLAAEIDALTISQSGKTEHQSSSGASKGLALQHDKREKSSRLSLRKLARKVF
jgi:tetratricopeptide (TPR) repeat protein